MVTPVQSVNTDQVPLGKLLIFSMPAISFAVVHTPAATILPAVYAKYTSITVVEIGVILLVSRIFDAVTDPAIGYFSDCTRSPIGRRKPWIIVGTLLSMFSFYFIMTPTAETTIIYFLIWSFLLYLGWTMTDIPYKSWAIELSRDYKERSRIAVYLAFAATIGGFIVPMVPIVTEPLTGSTEYSLEVLEIIAYLTIGLLLITVTMAILFAPEGKHLATEKIKFSDLFVALGQNRPFRWYVIFVVIWGVGLGVFNAGFFFYVDSYLGIGDKVPQTGLGFSISMFISLPIWLKIIHRWGKIKPIVFGWLANIFSLLLLAFVSPGPDSFWPAFILLCFAGVFGSGLLVAPMSLLGDVVDYDLLKSGVNRTGSYLAFLSLMSKFNFAFGGSLAFFLYGLFGFDPKIVNDETAIFGLLFTFIGLPVMLWCIAATVLWLFPIDARRHAIIKKRIDMRAERMGRSVTDTA